MVILRCQLFPNSSLGLKVSCLLKGNEITEDDPILFESTGPYHWRACRTLADEGYYIKVANPLHTKQIARLSIRKRKTDKVDSQNLAFLASQNYGYRFVETEEMAKKKAWFAITGNYDNQPLITYGMTGI